MISDNPPRPALNSAPHAARPLFSPRQSRCFPTPLIGESASTPGRVLPLHRKLSRGSRHPQNPPAPSPLPAARSAHLPPSGTSPSRAFLTCVLPPKRRGRLFRKLR